MKILKPFKEQVEEVNDFLKENSILILTSIFLSFIIDKLEVNKTRLIEGLNAGSAYLVVIFLFLLILYQMYKKMVIEEEEIGLSLKKFLNEFNFVMLILFLLLALFVVSFVFDLFWRDYFSLGVASGTFLGITLFTGIIVLSTGIPIFFGRFVIANADKETDNKKKYTWYIMSFLLLGIAVPLITFLARRNWMDLLIPFVPISTLVGWLILIKMVLNKSNKNQF